MLPIDLNKGPEILKSLQLENLRTWVNNMMPDVAIQVMAMNVLGAAHLLYPDLNKSTFVDGPNECEPGDELQYIMHESVLPPVELNSLMEMSFLTAFTSMVGNYLNLKYAEKNVVNGSVRMMFIPGHDGTNVLRPVIYMMTQKKKG